MSDDYDRCTDVIALEGHDRCECCLQNAEGIMFVTSGLEQTNACICSECLNYAIKLLNDTPVDDINNANRYD